MRLFHGTDYDNSLAIQQSGSLRGPVYLTPSREAAEQYGGDDAVVFELEINENDLLVDFDLSGGRLMTVDAANEYMENDDWTIEDYLSSGQSVAVTQDVSIK